MVNQRRGGLAPVLVLGALMLTALVLMNAAASDSDRFGALYSLLVLVNGAGLVTFLLLIGGNVRGLSLDLRARAPGVRLKLRMLAMFVAFSIIPVLIVYGFSIDFLRRGIDAWFDVRVDRALQDSLELSQRALELRMREALQTTEAMAVELGGGTPSAVGRLDFEALRDPSSLIVANTFSPGTSDLDALRKRSGADELALLDQSGALIAASGNATDIVPKLPTGTVLLQLGQGRNYVALDPILESGLFIRAAVNVPRLEIGGDRQILHAMFPIASRINNLARSVESALAEYTELVYLRDKLKVSFVMTLTLVLLFGLFMAIWFAFYSADRLVAPISDLAMGTRSVAEGNYETMLPVASQDELGFLVSSFNDMTRRIAHARDEVNEQRNYVETVLSNLSAGVLTLDRDATLITANDSAGQILGVDLKQLIGHSLTAIGGHHRILRSFVDAIQPQLRDTCHDWQKQVVIFGDRRKILMCRGTDLAVDDSGPSGHVIVFDDVTALIQSQREAAWGEVARRLAHEIKNPLTPIQLSAERLRHKFLPQMPKDQAEPLDRLTSTIIQQVETMKDMVNTFSDYARPPKIQTQAIDINDLILNVVELYRSAHATATITTQFDASLPAINADGHRLRQVFNNLIANAVEATRDGEIADISITTRNSFDSDLHYAEIRIDDRGCGISPDIIDTIFEPYVSNKQRGTGLGLAIVKKIVEEHGGMVNLENRPDSGATATIRLPLQPVADMPVQRSVV